MPSNQEVVISLRDIVNIIQRNRKKIFLSAAGCALFTAGWTLTEPVKFAAIGSFSEKSTTQAGMSQQFSAALMGQLGKEESEASSLFKSERILTSVAKRLNLQASIFEKGKKNQGMDSYLTLIRKNLISAYYQWVPTAFPLFADPPEKDIAITSIEYTKEIPYSGISLTFEDEDTFILTDRKEKIRAKVGDLVGNGDYKFKVEKRGDRLTGRTFLISLSSLNLVLKNLAGSVTAKPNVDDKSLINLSYTGFNRQQSATVVNELMQSYSDFIKHHQKSIAQAQLVYLEERQKNMQQLVRGMMQEHATKISSDLLAFGFPTAQSAMDFLSSSQAQQQQRIMMIDLEKMMLKKAKEAGYSHYDNITPHGDPGIINGILREIRELNKQRDNIALTLQEGDQQQDLNSFHAFLEELNTIKSNSESARDLLAELERGEIPSENNSLAKNSKYLVSHWVQQLKEADQAARFSDYSTMTAKNQHVDLVREQFSHYLNQMLRLFDVHADILQQRLVRQQSPHVEFQGIELPAARELYLTQSRHIQELESQTLQHHFLIENIQKEDFEAGSISNFLQDSISQQMIQQMAQLSLQLTDYHNRSSKEMERIREEIGVKKNFLVSQLKQSAQLLVLRQKLLKEKTRSLQETTLALIQQQISLLEQQLADHIDKRIIDLDNEYDVIAMHQRDLNQKMASLPIKWSDEEIIKQQMDLNKQVAAEISRLIETKNLASNLEVSRSTPIDIATPPLKPVSPRLPLFIMIGLFMGAFFSVTALLCRTLLHGVPISRENLLLSGYNTAGKLNRTLGKTLLDSDLETLRAVLAFLPRKEECQTLLIAEDQATRFSNTIASLLTKQGYRVLLLDLSFNCAESAGLLQYLEGKTNSPAFTQQDGYASIAAGGVSRFGSELVSQKRFSDLIKQLSAQYDWIIASTTAGSLTAEAKELRRQFDYAVLTINNETQQELPMQNECQNAIFVLL